MTDVVIVGEVRLYREGLAEALSQTEGIEIVGTAASLDEALALVGSAAPEVVLVDIAITDGIGAVRALTRRCGARVVVLAVPDRDSEILACAEAGIAGLVTRNDSIAELVESIRMAARDELACTPRLAGLLLRRVAVLGQRSDEPVRRRLTPREREVVGLVEQGLSNKEIASRLFIEVATVKNHVHNILEKLHVARRDAAVDTLRREDRAIGI